MAPIPGGRPKPPRINPVPADVAARRREEFRAEQLWLAVGRAIPALAATSPEVLREQYRARLANVPEDGWADDPGLVARELILAADASGSSVVDARRAERDAFVAERAANEARQLAEAEAARPPLSPDRPLFALIGQRQKNLGNREWARGERIDVGQMFWPPQKIGQLRRVGILVVDPEHPSDLDEADAINSLQVKAPRRLAIDGPTPSDARDTAAPAQRDTDESPDERKTRLARERQQRRRAKQKAAA